MFGLGKKKAPAKKGQKPTGRAPLRYLGARHTVQYARNTLGDVRGLETVAYPVMLLVALLTYRGERKRREKALIKARTAAIHQSLLSNFDPDRDKKRKRFIFF